MRLLVAGASGRTGRLVVEAALKRGHQVTALVRDPASLGSLGARLTVVVGDVLRPTSLGVAVQAQDAVISVVAPRPRTDGRVYVEGTRNLGDAAVGAGVNRFVVVSAEGAGVDPHRLTFAYRFVLRIPVVARLYPDIARMEAEVRARTDLDWTVVRPPILTNGPLTRNYRTAVGQVVDRGVRLSRADLAEFLLGVVEQDGFVRETVAIAR